MSVVDVIVRFDDVKFVNVAEDGNVRSPHFVVLAVLSKICKY